MTGRAGYINGKHYITYYEETVRLTRDGKYSETIELLTSIVDAIEEESKVKGMGVAPGYYEQLAIIYRKLNLIKEEKRILERFSKQKHAPGRLPLVLSERLSSLNAKYPDI